ncbi:MAG: hypothetical protein AMXMBFR4_14740 [Candidatus Hydrogenedentota bacterium]
MPPDQVYRGAVWIAAAGMFLLVIVARLRLLAMPLERDEGEYAYAGQLILQGVPPFVEVYNMKMPGIYAAYAAILAVFGQTAMGIRLGLLIVNLACAALVFVLARRVADRETALLSASTYALLSTGFGVLGVFAHATHFVVMFALAGLALLPPPGAPPRPTNLFLAGLALGAAFMMKQHGAPYIALAGAYLLGRTITSTETGVGKRLTGLTLFSIAVFVPFLVTCLIMRRAGAFEQFWFWTFDYARAYVSQAPASKLVRNLFRGFREVAWTWGTLLLWLLAAWGLLTVRRHGRNAVWIAGLFLAGFLGVCPGFFFRSHYFVLVLPAVSILAALGARRVADRLPLGLPEPWRALAPLLILGVGWLQALAVQYAGFFVQDRFTLSRAIYSTNPFPESVEIAAYIRERTRPEDRIGILGSEPQICFYAQRRSATPFVYMYPLMEEQPYALRMQNELIEDLEANPPAYIAYFPIAHSWFVQKNSEMKITAWIPQYLQKHYDKVGLVEIDDHEARYYWDDQQAGRQPRTRYFAVICKRKDYEPAQPAAHGDA